MVAFGVPPAAFERRAIPRWRFPRGPAIFAVKVTESFAVPTVVWEATTPQWVRALQFATIAAVTTPKFAGFAAEKVSTNSSPTQTRTFPSASGSFERRK